MVGAVNVDFVVAADRLPGPGETVVGAGLERHGGGKGANAAVAAARAGASTRLVGAVGADDTAASALGELREAGVDLAGVAVLEREATGVALIVVDREGENQIAVGAGANAAVSADWVRQQMRDLPRTATCVLVSTEIPGEAVIAAVEAATASGAPCLLNTAPPIPAVLGLLDRGPLLTPNATELVALTAMLDGKPSSTGATDGEPPVADLAGNGSRARDVESWLSAVQDAAQRLVELTSAAIVVTLGGAGAMVLTPAGQVEHVPPRVAEVRDTTGAGDTFNGVLAARLAAGDGLVDAAHAATVAASLSVSHPGARDGMPEAAAIETALRTG